MTAPAAPLTAEQIAGQRVTVVGGARSGLAAARLLARHGARVFLTERGEAEAGLVAALDAAGVAHEFGGHTARALDADFLVVSPGVPSTVKPVEQAARMGLAVYSEVERKEPWCRGARPTGRSSRTSPGCCARWTRRSRTARSARGSPPASPCARPRCPRRR